MRSVIIVFFITTAVCSFSLHRQQAQTTTQPKPPEVLMVLKPARVFDGQSAQLHEGWVIVVRGEKIESAGPAADVTLPREAKTVELPGLTLMPGLIDAHSH